MIRFANRRWRWAAYSALTACITLSVIATVVIRHAGPILKGRIEETLSARTGGRVSLDNLQVSIARGLEVSGDGLRVFPIEGGNAAPPLIAVSHFMFRSGLPGLFFKPMHVGAVQVTGLELNIPPKAQRRGRLIHPKGKIKILVDEILCRDSRLIIGTAKPDKDPKDFELRDIELHDFGPDHPWRYRAVLSNAIPPGEIHSAGSFGPLQMDDPGASLVNGKYTFDHADLNSIKGIGGMLSSAGEFQGELDRIVVSGTTETPDFSLDTANHPTALHTHFDAVVDGTTGDTLLQPVEAKLQDSDFTVRGKVIGIRGRGHRFELEVNAAHGRLQDFLDLAVKTQPPVMTGDLQMRANLTIRPGPESVTHKLKLTGRFALTGIHFSNPAVQDKVDMLSLRARGRPKEAQPGAADVASRIEGELVTDAGVLRFHNLRYELPGGRVDLAGTYSLDGQHFDFRGNVFTRASLRRMVASPWASLLVTPISPFFKASGGGAKIPVSITGTRSAPRFGLNLFGKR